MDHLNCGIIMLRAELRGIMRSTGPSELSVGLGYSHVMRAGEPMEEWL